MKKILVLGGAGFVGSHLVSELLKEDNHVTAVDDLSVGKRKHIPANSSNFTFVRASILDEGIDTYFRDIDIVFHLAALTRPQESILDPLSTNRVNIEGTLRMLIASHKHQVKRFVFASTTSVYGDQKTLPTPETAKPHPMSPYALSKLAGEEYCKLFETMYGLEYNAIRPFNIYGSRQSTKGGYAAAVPTFIRLLKKNKTPWITGDGTQARDYIHVSDVVSLLIKMAHSKVHGEIFNAGSGKNTSINDLYKLISQTMSKDIKPTHIAPVFEPKKTLGDIRKAQRLLGWEPRMGLKEGLKLTIKESLS